MLLSLKALRIIVFLSIAFAIHAHANEINSVDIHWKPVSDKSIVESQGSLADKKALISFVVPSNTWLRVKSKATSDLHFSSTYTNGLTVTRTLEKPDDNTYTLQAEHAQRVVSVYSATLNLSDITIHLGQPYSAPQRQNYAQLKANNASPKQVTQQPISSIHNVYQTKNSEQTLVFDVEGLKQVRISSMVYSHHYSQYPKSWNVNASLDGSKFQWLQTDSLKRKQYWLTDENLWGTSFQYNYLEIPEGIKTLEVSTSENVWLQVEKLDDNFLLTSNQEFLADSRSLPVSETSEADVTTKKAIANIVNNNVASASINKQLAQLAKQYGDAQIKEQLHNMKFVAYRRLTPTSSSLESEYVSSVPDILNVTSVHNILPAKQTLPLVSHSTRLFYQVKKGQPLNFKLPSDRLLPTVKLSLINPENTISYLHVDNKTPDAIHLTSVPRESVNSSPIIYKKGLDKIITLDNLARHQNAYLDLSSQESKTISVSSDSNTPLLLALDYAFVRPHPSTEEDWLNVLKTKQAKQGQLTATDYPISIANEYKHLEAFIDNRAEQFALSITKSQLHDLNKKDGAAIWKKKISTLKQLGLWQQYTVMLKGLVKHTNGELYYWAIQQLEAYYSSTQNLLALEQLWSAVFAKPHEKSANQKLAELSFQQGQYKNTLFFALLSEARQQDIEIALWSASKLGYWQLYLQLIESLPTEKQAFYQGLHAWMIGDTQKASMLWSIEETAIRKSDSFKALLTKLDLTHVEVPLTSAKGAIKSFHSHKNILVKSSKRETKQSLAIATPDEPVEISLEGPVTLTLEMRQIKTNDSDTKTDWINIAINNENYLALINDGHFTSELLIDESDKRLSSNNRSTFRLGEGNHYISIKPDHFDTAVAVKIYQPAFSEVLYADLKQDCELASAWQIVEYAQVFDACHSEVIATSTEEPESETRFIFEDDGLVAFNQAAIALREWKNNQHHDQLLIAHQIIRKNSDNPVFRPLLSQLKKLTNWYLLQPTQSAGSQLIPLKNNHSINEENRALNALLPPLAQQLNGHELQVNRKLEILTEYRQSKQARLVFTYKALPYMQLPVITAEITLPNGKIHKAAIQNLRTSVYMDLPAGEQSINIVLPELYQHSKAFVALEVQTDKGQWQTVDVNKKRRLFVAEQQQPLKYYIQAPAVLKIQSYNQKGDFTTRFLEQKEAGFFTINRDDKVRVYQLALADESHLSKPVYYPSSIAKQTLAGDNVLLSKNYHINTVSELESNDLEAGNDSLTYGAGYQWQQRFNFDEDDAQQTERFHQASISMRDYVNTQNVYWRGDFKFRMHHTDHKVLATSQFVDWMLPNSNQRIFSRIDLHYQASLNNQSSAWSGKATLGWHNQFDLNATLRNYLDISAFALTVDEEANEDLYWDNDVLSEYKKNHSNGINISNRMRYQAFTDWQVDARFDLRTNEISESLSADSASIGLSTNVYIKGADLALGYQRKHYFSDDNRRDSYERNRFTIRLQKRWWQSFSNLWHVNASINYDDALNEPSINLGISWNNTNSSVLDDFRKNEIRFRSLIKQQHNLVDYIEGSTQ